PAHTENDTLSLHDALPICGEQIRKCGQVDRVRMADRILAKAMREAQGLVDLPEVKTRHRELKIGLLLGELERLNRFQHSPHDLRSEEHTSELQSRGHLVCR